MGVDWSLVLMAACWILIEMVMVESDIGLAFGI
jgi:hypothetical protein